MVMWQCFGRYHVLDHAGKPQGQGFADLFGKTIGFYLARRRQPQKERVRLGNRVDSTEAALVVVAHKTGLYADVPPANIDGEFSFNSHRKRMTVIEKLPEGLVAHVKGAPEGPG